MTLELYLSPRKTPDVSDRRLPLLPLAQRWNESGAFGRETRAVKATNAYLDKLHMWRPVSADYVAQS